MIRLLLVDKNTVTLDGLAIWLSPEPDIEIIGKATTGAEALRLINEGTMPDILISDVHLSDINGTSLVQHFADNYPFVRTMLFTTETDIPFMADAFSAGVKCYLSRKANREELIFAIRQVYNGRHYIGSHLAECLVRLFVTGRRNPPQPEIAFSKREQEVLELISDGLTNDEIADRLFTSRRTVEGHRQAMIKKAGVKNTAQLIKYAMRHQLLNEAEPVSTIPLGKAS